MEKDQSVSKPLTDRYIKLIQLGEIYPHFVETVADTYGKEKAREVLHIGLLRAIGKLERMLKNNINFSEHELYEKELEEYKQLLSEIEAGKEVIDYKGIKI